MSRRSSVSSSSVSTSMKSGLEDDPLMRDCYDLRRRLLQTEQSLQSMKPPNISASDKSRPTSRTQQSYDRKKDTATDIDRNYRLSPDDARDRKAVTSNRQTTRQKEALCRSTRDSPLRKLLQEQNKEMKDRDHRNQKNTKQIHCDENVSYCQGPNVDDTLCSSLDMEDLRIDLGPDSPEMDCLPGSLPREKLFIECRRLSREEIERERNNFFRSTVSHGSPLSLCHGNEGILHSPDRHSEGFSLSPRNTQASRDHNTSGNAGEKSFSSPRQTVSSSSLKSPGRARHNPTISPRQNVNFDAQKTLVMDSPIFSFSPRQKVQLNAPSSPVRDIGRFSLSPRRNRELKTLTSPVRGSKSTFMSSRQEAALSPPKSPVRGGERLSLSPQMYGNAPSNTSNTLLEEDNRVCSPKYEKPITVGKGISLSPRARLLYERNKQLEQSSLTGGGEGRSSPELTRPLSEYKNLQKLIDDRRETERELDERMSPRAKLLYERRQKMIAVAQIRRNVRLSQFSPSPTNVGHKDQHNCLTQSPRVELSLCPPIVGSDRLLPQLENVHNSKSPQPGRSSPTYMSPRTRNILLSKSRTLPDIPENKKIKDERPSPRKLHLQKNKPSLPPTKINTYSNIGYFLDNSLNRFARNKFEKNANNRNFDAEKERQQRNIEAELREQIERKNIESNTESNKEFGSLAIRPTGSESPQARGVWCLPERPRDRQQDGLPRQGIHRCQYSHGPSRGYSSSPESAQVLTLADLTPPTSEPNSLAHNRRGMSSLGIPYRSHSIPDLRNGSTQSSPRDREFDNRSFGSTGDYDHDTLRKKLNRQREENSQLVNQNHKLMSEMENMSYEIHQAKNKVKIVTRELDEERKRIPSLEDRIVTLESQLADHEDRSRMSERRFAECKDELQAKTEELRSVLESSNLAESELREESRMRKRTESQLQDAMRNVEDLSEKLADQEAILKSLRKQSEEKERQLRENLSQSQKDNFSYQSKTSSLENEIQELKEEIRLLQQEGIAREDSTSSLHQENASLRATISRQSQKIGRLENELRKNDSYFKDSSENLEIIERQRERIVQYQQEIEDTKVQMARLEELVHRVQEQSIKEHVNTPPSQTSDSGICNSTQTVNGYSSPIHNGSYLNGDIFLDSDISQAPGSAGKARAMVADLKLKLALKDAEIQKLQASAVARTAAQQRHIAGLSGDGGTMDGLRSELSAIVERSRMGDRKQHELEQIITRLEDELSRYSAQNIQLEERLADKMAQIASLEGKLGQRNLRVVDVQKELEDKISEINDLLREVRQKGSQITHLERQLEEKSSEQGSRVSQVRELKDELRNKDDEINTLKEQMDEKNSEVRDALALVERSKTLQGEQCKELDTQIEQLQKKFDEKNLMVIQLETALTATRQELELRSTITEQMERNLEDHKHEIIKKSSLVEQQDRKFSELHAQAEHATGQMKQLEKSLADCQREIKVYIEQLEAARREHEADMKQAKDEISKLEYSLQEVTQDVQQKAGYIGKLEQALSERQTALQKEQERAREMQDSRLHLQQQVTLIEQEIDRERNASQLETNEMHQKLQEARAELEKKTSELKELSSTMREMHQDMKTSSASIVELEQLLQEARTQNDRHSVQLQTTDHAYKETKASLSQQTKRNGELEEKLRRTEEELKDRDGQVAKLDNELTKLQNDFQDTITQLKTLEDLLDTSKRVVEEKEQKVTELDKLLNESVDELQQKDKSLKEKDGKLAELDQALKESRKEIKNREAQVSQMDSSMREQKTEIYQKTMALEQNLNQSRHELSERAVEIAELKAKYDQSQDQLRQTKNRLAHYEKVARQQQEDLKKRIAQLTDLEVEAEKLRKRKQDSEETAQELRLSREQLQNTHAELMEARRELLRYQRKEQELVQELDDAHVLLQAKEGDCTRLAKDLGAAQVREAQAEARCVQEMRRSSQQSELKQVSQEKELQRLQESYNKLLTQKEEIEAEKRILATSISNKEKQLTQELSRSHDDTTALAEDNKRLTSQLMRYEDEAKAMSEALVIKDAEIARLEARISGYERAMFGRNQFDRLGPGGGRPSPRPSSPRTGHVRHVTSPRHLSGVSKSNTDYNLHNLSTGSSLSYLDNEDYLDYNHNVSTNRAPPLLRVSTEGSVSQSSRNFNRQTNTHGSRADYHNTSGMETLEGLLLEANRALNDDDPLLYTPTSGSPARRTKRDQTPPQKEAAVSSEESGTETLKEQLEAKKAAAGLTRGSEGTPLDPSKCRASLEERLRASEQRRKQIDKQLNNMKTSFT